MESFYFSQFKHEVFWQYLNRLSEFCAQCVDYCIEKWKICQVIFESLNNEYRGHFETMYPEGLCFLFTKTPDEIWDFFEYLAQDSWECENARETFSHPSLDSYMMYVTSLDESQIEDVSYKHSHTLCAPISCDCCDFFNHDVDTCPLLGRPDKLGALASCF